MQPLERLGGQLSHGEDARCPGEVLAVHSSSGRTPGEPVLALQDSAHQPVPCDADPHPSTVTNHSGKDNSSTDSVIPSRGTLNLRVVFRTPNMASGEQTAPRLPQCITCPAKQGPPGRHGGHKWTFQGRGADTAGCYSAGV